MSKKKKNAFQKVAEKAQKFFQKFEDEAESMNMGRAVIDEDGTEVMWEGELTEGSALLIEADGETDPAPEGTHTFLSGDNEGFSVTLNADGVVEVVTPPDDPDEDGEFTQEELERVLAMQHHGLKAQEKKLKELMAQVKTLENKVEKFASAPSDNKKKRKRENEPPGSTTDKFTGLPMNPLYSLKQNDK